MNTGFRPIAKLSESTLHIAFRDPAMKATSVTVKVVVDLDEFESPAGVEILAFEDQLGENAADGLSALVVGTNVRFSYDPEVDAAAIGVDIGTGTRTLRSVPKQAQAGLDASRRLLTIDIPGF